MARSTGLWSTNMRPRRGGGKSAGGQHSSFNAIRYHTQSRLRIERREETGNTRERILPRRPRSPSAPGRHRLRQVPPPLQSWGSHRPRAPPHPSPGGCRRPCLPQRPALPPAAQPREPQHRRVPPARHSPSRRPRPLRGLSTQRRLPPSLDLSTARHHPW